MGKQHSRPQAAKPNQVDTELSQELAQGLQPGELTVQGLETTHGVSKDS